jgi:biotin carboxylase
MKILVLGGGSDQIELIYKLKKRGHKVLFADYNNNPPAVATGAHHVQVSTLDINAIIHLAKSEKVDRVFTACIDQALVIAAEVSEILKLDFPLNAEIARIVTHKVQMKNRFIEIGVPSPIKRDISVLSPDEIESLLFPLVVKPSDCNGSLGVCRVDDVVSLKSAINQASQFSRSGSVIVEDYLEGEELSVDAFIDNGIAEILLVTSSHKLPGVSGFPILRSDYSISRDTDERIEIKKIVQAIAEGFGICYGPLIVQIIKTKGGLHVLEFGARIAGGSKHQFIKRIIGFDVMSAYVDILFGEWQGPISYEQGPQHASMIYVYCNPGVYCNAIGVEELLFNNIIDNIFYYKTPGAIFEGHSASRDRVLSYLCTADTAEELSLKMLQAEEALMIIDDQGDDIRWRMTKTYSRE